MAGIRWRRGFPCGKRMWSRSVKKINEICTLAEDDLQEKIHIDVPMPVSYVSFRLVEELELLEPFGTGNSKPVFAQKDLKFVSARALGKAGNVLRFTVEDSEQKRWEMMYFGGKGQFRSLCGRKIRTDCAGRTVQRKRQSSVF